MSGDPLTTVRALYDAINAGDAAAMLALYAPDVRIEQTPELPWGGVFEGVEGFRRFGTLLRSHIESRVTVERMFAAGADVVVVGRTIGRVKATGAPFDVAIAHVLTVRDGRIVHARFYIDTAAMLAALKV